MAYYGRYNYAAGDNYGRLGNYPYAAGGLLSSLKKVVTAVAPSLAMVPGIGGVVGTAAKIASGQALSLPGTSPIDVALNVASGLASAAGPRPGTGIAVSGPFGTGVQIGHFPASPFGGPVGMTPSGAPVVMVGGRRRGRMNPMNVKALRRASRRIDSFARTARKALKHTGFMLVSRASRGGRGGSPGVITRSEAARALKR